MNLPSKLFDGNASVQTLLCQPDKEIIGEISPYDFNATFKFNTYSEISFTIDRYYNDLFEGEAKIHPYYDLIESLRVIYLRGIGHFVIQDVDENVGETESKSITCFSLEYSTGQKYLENFYVNTGEEGSIETMYHAQQYGAEYAIDNYYTLANKGGNNFDAYERYYIKEYSNDGEASYNYVEVQILDANAYDTYDGANSETTLYIKKYPNVRFYWPTCPELSLLHHVFDRIPEWKIGHVDKELWYQERTFSEDRTAVYDFLYNTAADTFGFVMVWDSINGVVNFYKTEEDGVTTDNYIRTNTYNQGFIYYSDTNGTKANPQPANEDEVINGIYYINIGQDIETQWDTDVFISKDNLASSLDVKYSTDDIKTKLKITGNDTLDVRDVNLGQNYILNLSYYNTPLWLGEDLHRKYNIYTNELVAHTAQYKKYISTWSAAYNEYSDLMNYVPVEPRVMLIGDEFEKLYCVYSKYRRTVTYAADKVYYTYEKGKYTEVNPAPSQEDVENDKNYFYIEDVATQVANLQTKLKTYKVDQQNGLASTSEKTEDVLLTLENNKSDSATIRVRYDENGENYLVYRTRTEAATGVSNTITFSLTEWVNGDLTAEKMNLTGFKIKSIGTLGAYFCLVRDETNKAELEDYGIRLLQEKQNTYTKIFITQTEGYMNKEGSKCIASDELPTEGEYPDGTKWLDTDTVTADGKLIMKIRDKGAWIDHVPDDQSYEDYARFYENYVKLGNVQTILAEKQRQADYLLNGVPLKVFYFTKEDISLNNLLYVIATHFKQPGYDLYMTKLGEPEPSGNIKEGSIWFQTVNDGYSIYANVRQYNGGWKDVVTNINDMTITGYDENLGIVTVILNPEYSLVTNDTKFLVNQNYVVLKNGVYKKPFVQPESTEDLSNMYECVINNEILSGVKCYFSTDEGYYTFTTTSVIKPNSILTYNKFSNQLIIGIDTITPIRADSVFGMTEVKFTKIAYYIVEGDEYAVYLVDGIPHVSYARSQGLCLTKMNAIKEVADMSNYFDTYELIRLSPFIREDEFSDSNFLLTGYESEEEQMNIKQELLKAGEDELKKICQPKLSFNATMANILTIPEFAPLRNQFKLGNFVRVGIREGYVKRARLLEVQMSFDDPSDFSATFGDLISTRSEIDKHAELLQQAVSAGQSVASNQSKWQRGADKATELDNAINNGLRNAALSVGAADGQSITWDKYGIRGRKLIDGTTDQYEDKQFALINNKLVFTDDNWQTSRAVVGEFEIERPNTDGSTTIQNMYGLLADAIVGGYIQGTEIHGGTLTIGNKEKGSYFHVADDGSVSILTDGKSTYAQKTDLDVIDQAYRYSVALSYEGSTVFASTDDSVETTVTATVYERGEDITKKFSNTAFNWIRSSSNATEDAIWNKNHENKSNILKIKHTDVIENSHFSCKVDLEKMNT